MSLQEFFIENPKIAIAFSGGVDSAYLLYSAVNSGAHVRPYYVKSLFQPQFEMNDAVRMAESLGVVMKVIEVDVLNSQEVSSNPKNRCYYCKQLIFKAIAKAAAEDGFSLLLDGTNASDDSDDRPGMRALKELNVRSPLRECGLSKSDIRKLSKEAGLFTWDKPAYACLATRIPTGEVITEEKLFKTESAENYLFSMGFTDFRVRILGDCGRIQLPESQIPALLDRRDEIVRELKKYYSALLLDLEVRGE